MIAVYRIKRLQYLFASLFALLPRIKLDVVKRNSATAAFMIATTIKSKVQNKYPFHNKNLACKYSKRGRFCQLKPLFQAVKELV